MRILFPLLSLGPWLLFSLSLSLSLSHTHRYPKYPPQIRSPKVSSPTNNVESFSLSDDGNFVVELRSHCSEKNPTQVRLKTIHSRGPLLVLSARVLRFSLEEEKKNLWIRGLRSPSPNHPSMRMKFEESPFESEVFSRYIPRPLYSCNKVFLFMISIVDCNELLCFWTQCGTYMFNELFYISRHYVLVCLFIWTILWILKMEFIT